MARDFDGVTDRIDYANAGNYDSQVACTISIWVYAETAVVQLAQFFWGSMNATNDGIANRFTVNDFAVGFNANTDNTNLVRLSDDDSMSGNTWEHVLVTWDGTLTATGVHIYVDGSEVSYQTTTNGIGNLIPGIGRWCLGSRFFDENHRYDGRLAAVGWWDRVLSAGEIAALAAGYSPLFFLNGLQFAPDLIRHPRDPVSGRIATLDGTSVIAHPRIIEEGSARGVWAVAAAPPVGDNVPNILMHLAKMRRAS